MSATDAAPSRRDACWLLLLVLAFVAFGTLFALYLVFSDGEWSFLVFGRMILRGEIRLFQDEIMGRRLPLPFYVIGLSQVVAGPGLLLGRLWSLAFGVATLLLTFALGRALGGRACGFLAVLFLVTHPVVVGFYASAAYYSMSAVLILAGVLAIVAWRSRWGRLVGMACFSVLWLTRAHLVPMIPFVLVYLLVQARDRRERAALLLITALPPVAFLLWSPNHIKILAYVPVLERLVEPLGYHSLLEMGAEAMLSDTGWARAVVWFAKRHFFWICASAALAVAWGAACAPRSEFRRVRPPSAVVFAGALALYTLASQAVMIYMYLKVVAAWVATFAPLWAVVLGWTASALLERGRVPAAVRTGVVVALAGVFALSPVLVKHAAMPKPLPPQTTLSLMARDAERIRSVMPKGARVFLLGSPIPAYVAEVRPYLQQIFSVYTLVPSRDQFAVTRSGLWGPRQVDEWLGRDASFALIEPGRLDALEAIESYRPVIGQIRALLDRNFTRVGKGGEAPWTPAFDIYTRRSRLAAAVAR